MAEEEGLDDSFDEDVGLKMFSASDTPSVWLKAEHHHRHEFLANRLQAYSDAVFAIVGTILIVYIQNTAIPKFENHDKSLRQHVIDEAPFFSVYHFTFVHISVIWLNHTRVFSVIERVDYILIWLNMLLLYSVSFVPLTFGVLGEYNDTYAGILIPSLKIVVINTLMVVIVWYVFRKKRLLPRDMSTQVAKYTRRAMYFKLLIAPVFAILAIVFGKISLLAGQIFFYSSIFVVLIPKTIVYIINKRWNNHISSIIVQILNFSVTVSKERVEFFTDGVYSIVATLVILEITESGIPSRQVVDDDHSGDLLQALSADKLRYFTYFTTFLVISLLWIVHHSLFNFIKRLNPLMFLTHQCSLMLVGVVPGAIEVFAEFYGSSKSEDEATAIQLASLAIASVSLFQFVLLVLMYFADGDCVDKAIFHTKSSLHLLLKVIAVPITCLAAYWSSFGSTQSRHYVFYVVYVCTPVLFIMINIMMHSTTLHSQCWNCCKRLRAVMGKQHNKTKHSFV